MSDHEFEMALDSSLESVDQVEDGVLREAYWKTGEAAPDLRPRQRVSRRDVPRIWKGKNEPDLVEYLDEEGTVKVRPGRRDGQPYEFEVEDIEDDEEPDE